MVLGRIIKVLDRIMRVLGGTMRSVSDVLAWILCMVSCIFVEGWRSKCKSTFDCC